jgi:hypothetical protein
MDAGDQTVVKLLSETPYPVLLEIDKMDVSPFLLEAVKAEIDRRVARMAGDCLGGLRMVDPKVSEGG